jgi:hypothetical protein
MPIRRPYYDGEELHPEQTPAGWEAEQVALAGFDPDRVSLWAAWKAELMWTAGEIPHNASIRATAERLTIEERERDLARQDYLDWMEKHSLG